MLSRLDSHQIRNRPGLLALALTLALFSGVVSASGTPPAGGAKEQIQQATLHHWGWANPEIAAMVEHSNQALVDVLERSDQALKAQEPVLAANNLKYANKLARSIELQMPFTVMKDQLENAKGKLEAGAVHGFIDQLAPVYDSITDLQLVAPKLGLEVKGKVEQAQRLARRGRHKEAINRVNQVLAKIVSVKVYVPILDVQGEIDNARHALQQDEIAVARSQVEKALGSMIPVVQDITSVM